MTILHFIFMNFFLQNIIIIYQIIFKIKGKIKFIKDLFE